MRIIIIDRFHMGHVVDWPEPTPEIKLLKPKTITLCDCNGPEEDQERFEFDAQEVAYRAAFTSPDGEVALFSTSGKSMDIFNCGFDRAFRDKPYGRNETLYFGCHDYNA